MPLPDADKYDVTWYVLANSMAGAREWIPADPSRVCLVFASDNIGFAYTVEAQSQAQAAMVLQVSAGAMLELLWAREGPLCQYAWKGNGNGTGGNMVAYGLRYKE